jgi:integrase
MSDAIPTTVNKTLQNLDLEYSLGSSVTEQELEALDDLLYSQRIRAKSYIEAFRRWMNVWSPQFFATFMGDGVSDFRGTRVTPEQEMALLGAAVANGWPMMELRVIGAIDTGIRRGEMMRIQLKHVNFKTWRIALLETKSDKPQFAHVRTSRLRDALMKRRFIGDEGYVFGTTDGRSISRNTLLTDVARLFKAAEVSYGRTIGLTWHDLRHEFVSHLLEAGVPVPVVQKLARHKSIETTMKYFKASEAALESGADVMQLRHVRA